MKTCARCCRTLPLDAFHRATRHAQGRRNECGPCRSALTREWRLRGGGPRPAEPADDIAVSRAVAGDPPAGLTTAELREAVRRLTARRMSSAAIAARMGIATRTVQRHRQYLGLVPAGCTHCIAGVCPWHSTRAAA